MGQQSVEAQLHNKVHHGSLEANFYQLAGRVELVGPTACWPGLVAGRAVLLGAAAGWLPLPPFDTPGYVHLAPTKLLPLPSSPYVPACPPACLLPSLPQGLACLLTCLPANPM